MKKHLHDLQVVANKKVSEDYFRLKLTYFNTLPEIKPAQFVEIKVENSPETFLRRPISVYDVNYHKNTLSLLIRVVGKGTEQLSKLKKDDFVNLIYPLGNSFTLPSDDKILLVGGGCGIAPLLYTARYFSELGFRPTSLLGFRDKDSVVEEHRFKKFSDVLFTTDNGSYGECGNVLEHSIFKQTKFPFSKIYACGPEAMLKSLAKWSINNNVDCEVSLENLMACGIGACLCCVQNTNEGHKCVCVDGPVFNVKDIVW
jgi:dihydroorotate dehydrogenase electron transfer subunit